MRTFFQPVPVGGWNQSVPLDLMPATDAERMVNFIPREKHLEMRSGSLELTTSALATAVQTLAVHREEDGTETLVAASNGNIYTVNTSTGATTSKGSGYTNNKWQTVNFNNLLLFVNGADAPLQFDGTTLGAFASPVSGATGTDLNGVTVFKGRAYYWENNASKFWYAAAGSYGGALASFPLEYTTKKGGYVVECLSWTRDSGDGVDDLFVILLSTGEVLVYEGSDPASGYDWSLVGSFTLGKPIAVRGSTNLASDRIIITEDGIVNLSTALQVARASEKGNVGSKIVPAAKEATSRWKANYGWEIFYHDKQSLLIANIPRNATTYEQYCMNTNTGAWTKFNGWDGITFAEIGGELYMGGSDGHIRQCFTGTSDDGVAIRNTLVPAFTMMEMPDRKKKLCFVTLTTNFVNKNKIGIGGLADFEPRAFGNAAVADNQTGNAAEWDTSGWDEDFWGETSSTTINQHIIPVTAYGYAVSIKINMISSVQTANIYSLKYKYQTMRTI